MNTIQIKLYDIFKTDLQLSDSKAAALLSALEEVIVQKERENNYSNATNDNSYLFQKDISIPEIKIEQPRNNTYIFMYLWALVHFLGILSGLYTIVKFIK